MKTKLLILIFSIMLICSASAYANSESVFFDFENYTTAHSSPSGWPSSNTSELSPAKVDEQHGTSFMVQYKGIPVYAFSEPISKGEFLVSFEIYFEDFEQSFRLHASSPTSGSDAHSILRFNGGEVQCANTSADTWSFDKITAIQTHRWYQIDMLFDMDSGKLYYYVDGVEYGNKKIAFSDMSKITFRTESGKNNAVLYLDNVSFKYKSAGSFECEFKNGIAQAGKEDIILKFQDIVDSSTIDGISVYNMGSDPFSYTEQKIEAYAQMDGIKNVRLVLSEPIAKNSIYKVYAPNVKTIFGDSFTNDAVYFATGGARVGRIAINADFSTIETVGARKPVSPVSDITWTKSVEKINPLKAENVDGEEVAVVNFVPNKGSSDLPDNLTLLTRTIASPYIGKVDMEFMLQAKNGKQCFRIKDSSGTEYDFIKIIGEEVFTGETKVMDISPDTWYKFGVSVDTDTQQVTLKSDDMEIWSGETEIYDVAEIVFEQRNLENTYGVSEIAQADCANMLVAYFRLYAQEDCTSVILINFEDRNGDIHFPDGAVVTDIRKVNLIFSDKLNKNTLENGVSFTKDGVEISSGYEYSDGVYSILIPDYLNGLSDYHLSVSDTIKDENNSPVMLQNGIVTTDKGLFIGNKFVLEELDSDNYIINAELIHTDSSCNDIYISYAAYKGNLMVDYKLDIISLTTEDRKIEFSNTYEKDEAADKFVAFLWDGFDTKNPIVRAQVIK